MKEPQNDQQDVIEILRRADGPVESEELEQQLGLKRAGVFETVTDLMAAGERVYFEGQSEMTPKGPLAYRYARKPEELYETRVAVRDQAERFSELQNGIENAQVSFHTESQLDFPVLHTVYAVGVNDSDEFVIHFTRCGEKRDCTYRGFPGIDMGRAGDAELLDRCFESWEVGQLIHYLVQYGKIEIRPCIALPIRSVDLARVHVEHPKGAETLGIDLPPECGGPFEALGEQIATFPDSRALDPLRQLLALVTQ